MKLCEIIEKIEKEFPVETAYEWDNPGLLIGDEKRDIKKVLVTLDINRSSVEQAVSCGADLILSHHPILFTPVKKITADTEAGRLIMTAIENKISIYAAHTNCDVAKNGINARLAEIFALENAELLEENGLGRIGNLKKAVKFSDFAEKVKVLLNTPCVRVSGDENRMVQRIAVGSGACADSIPTALKKGADVMITADMKYHDMMNYTELGINIIDAGHYPTEIIVTDIFSEILSDCGVEIIKSHNSDIFKYI